ncbi:ABC transporter substrate-binding protein [Streptomyces sp. MI02-7b]|uniref:ABC transporter substrate-binding protein n=1 Tax=Streptomyces sp. MI02-7b TaxID=462941 RepID=UPI0029A4283B|nr:ABC transporter substrate-binding protein [Streptomyces sp. MI02-7b]MDX3073718.1 ABC transporter substrate-binding protein [Streptomyces sp. MI02-7b]
MTGSGPVRAYTLTGPDGAPYPSAVPGTLGGHRRGRLYGRLDCPSALRALARQYAQWKASRANRDPETMELPRIPDNEAPPPSPLLTAGDLAVLEEPPAPAAHTAAELAAVLGLLGGARVVAVGHSRDAASRDAAVAFAAAWRAAGREIAAVVDWPEEAASWLRPAQRLTADAPDAWAVAAAPRGWAQLVRRLRRGTGWDAARTAGFAALGDPRIAAATGTAALQGMRGAAPDGGVWHFDRGWVVRTAAGGVRWSP